MPDFEISKSSSSVTQQAKIQYQLNLTRGDKSTNQQLRKAYAHGKLPESVDIVLAFGVLKCGAGDAVLSELKKLVFPVFAKCLHICMANLQQAYGESCEICDNVSDLARHASCCNEHPANCGACTTFFNLIEYHLSTCDACDMNLCTKIKLKLLKYNNSINDGLLDLWPKIQLYLTKLFPYWADSHPTMPPLSKDLTSGYEINTDYVNDVADELLTSRGLEFLEIAEGPPQSTAQSQQFHPDYHSLCVDELGPEEGYGSIINGEPRQLRLLSQLWTQMKDFLDEHPRVKEFPTAYDGVILTGKNSGLTVINGQYFKNSQWYKVVYIGRGAAGKCHMAVDRETQSQFVVKKIALTRYSCREIELWSELEHPNLVQLYGAMRIGKNIYLFSELYQAGNMLEHIDRQEFRMLDQWSSLYYMQQLLDALVYLKMKGILHDDIKADNIFLKPGSFSVGLGDFGLSKKGICHPGLQPEGGQHQWSPEKAKSDGHGFPSDVWALNCTFVHMLSGHPVWWKRYRDIPFLHYKIAIESPPLADIPGNLIPLVDCLIKKAWLVDPSRRPDASTLLRDESFSLLKNDPCCPDFYSHFLVDSPTSEMEVCASSESGYTIDDLLQVMDNPEERQYIQEVMTSIGTEEPRAEDMDSAASASSRHRLLSSYHTLESIVEELPPTEDPSPYPDHSVRKKQRMCGPLVMPTAEQRRSKFAQKSQSSPNVVDACNSKGMLQKQTSSPAVLDSKPGDPVASLLDPCIFDLQTTTNRNEKTTGTSGYHTGTFQSGLYESQSPSSYQVGMDLDLEVDADKYQGMPYRECDYYPSSYSTGPSANFSNGPYSLSLANQESSERPCIIIVNGLNRLETTEIELHGSEIWMDIVKLSIEKVRQWNMETYTFVTEDGLEIDYNKSVEQRSIHIFVMPCSDQSDWYVKNGKILTGDFR